MKPTRPPWPQKTYIAFEKAAQDLGYTSKRLDAQKPRWKLLDVLLAYANTHPDVFRRN